MQEIIRLVLCGGEGKVRQTLLRQVAKVLRVCLKSTVDFIDSRIIAFILGGESVAGYMTQHSPSALLIKYGSNLGWHETKMAANKYI